MKSEEHELSRHVSSVRVFFVLGVTTTRETETGETLTAMDGGVR
jgi:hypothetical protein